MEKLYVLVWRSQDEPHYWQKKGDYFLHFLGVFKTSQDAFDSGKDYIEKHPYIQKENMRVFDITIGDICPYVQAYWD